MARIRSIHPGITSDEVYMSMSMAAKAAWPLLWTECDDHGVFEWKPIVLKARIFPADVVDFVGILAEYEDLGCVQKTEIDGKPVGLVRNFCRYQRPKKPKYRFDIAPSMANYVGLKADELPPSPEPVPNQSVTSSEISSQRKEEGGISSVIPSEDKSTSRRKAPRRISYPPRFQVFWDGYPTDALMSKSEALGEWQKLSPEDQEAAISALPAFKSSTSKLGPEHRVIHACRYLKKRRFDGFVDEAKRLKEAAEVASTKVYVKYGTDAGDAWERAYRLKGKIPPRDQAGGWYHPTEWPPENVQRETSDQAA